MYISFALWVYVFRATTPSIVSNQRFERHSVSGDQFSTDSFEFRFHLSRNFQFSIPKEYDRSTYIYIHGPLTLLELDLRRVSNYYQCSRVEYRNTKRRNSSFFSTSAIFKLVPLDTRIQEIKNKTSNLRNHFAGTFNGEEGKIHTSVLYRGRNMEDGVHALLVCDKWTWARGGGTAGQGDRVQADS